MKYRIKTVPDSMDQTPIYQAEYKKNWYTGWTYIGGSTSHIREKTEAAIELHAAKPVEYIPKGKQ